MTLIKSISGIRGTIGGKPEDGLSPLAIVKFVAAYATFIRKSTKLNTNKIVVGRDARISGPMVKQIVLGTLTGMGFDVVDREATTAQKLPEAIDRWTKLVESGKMDIPVDGLVICYDDTDYAASGSVTGHHATRAGFAFKWQDEAVDTKLKYIEWSCAVSTISPVAVFEPVQIEGTTVSRASLCNISEIERLGIGKECTLSVIKANKIIPKCIAVKDAVGAPEIPSQCPVCHAPTKVHVSENSGTKTLHCTNPDCTAKNVKKFTRFVSKWGMDIDGLSIQTMLRFMNAGFIHEFADIFRLKEHFGEISQMEGFGEKSVANMEQSIEKSRQVHPVNFIFALCIPLIGVDAGKKIVAAIGFEGFLQRLHQGDGFEDIEGIGAERSRSIVTWYQNEKNRSGFEDLLHELSIEHVEVQDTSSGSCAGLSFVITGDVHHYKNRDEFKAYVESQGGKVTGSVSKKTAYLVNNDVESASSKNRKAKELGIPIIMSYGYAPAESENELDPDEIEYHKSLGNMCDVYLELKYADMITEDYEELTEDDIQEMVENGEMLLINVQLHKNRRTMKASCQIQATPKFNYYEE